MMRKWWIKGGLLVSLFLGTAPAHAAYSESCDTEAVQAMAPDGVTVAFATREVFADRDDVYKEANWGCHVYGYVTNTDPGPNKVLFTLALPDNYTGRYVFLGIGGAAGKLPKMERRLLAKGYALAGTDAGTAAKSIADFSFMSDEAKLTDFIWRGVKTSSAATQAITRRYYGKDKLYRYISGCSGGGQMGLGNARRFGGENFDGFLVGATPFQGSLYLPNVMRLAAHVQNKPSGWIPPELIEQAGKAILAAYDDVDGARDGLIRDQRNIESFDDDILRKSGFSEDQVETFNLIRNTYQFPSGGNADDGKHAGFPFTDISGWSRFLLGRVPPPWADTRTGSPADMLQRGVAFIHIMTDTKTRAVSPDTDYWKVSDFKEMVRLTSNDGVTMPFDDPMDFSTLANSGSKMIIWHGVNDESMSYLESLSGYEALRTRFAGSDEWLQYVAFPGMWHCRGGTGPTDHVEQMLEAMIAWVEKGEKPSSIVANRYLYEKGRTRSFLICTEPKRAHLKQAGLDPDDADNWECRET
ncbi:MAG: tannase/feruloyl esterase family alpha/beta hydrolase [Novosphingobium sp.]|nr:tannase/feruloyl esterase family alpha/beta hydrolase [Novosphingobium sp.]